ncbi:MAG: sugar phosphate nucleotidyltransferase [Candidatus Muiribacteriota bacterium]
MNLIILAAGTGSRLYPLTKNTPKSLLDLGDGVSLLEKQIEAAIKSDLIDRIYIVTGYKAGQIEEKIKEYNTDIEIETIFNPFFSISNNLVAVWCANSVLLQKDFIITNGDNLYRKNVLPEFASIEEGIYLTISYKDEYDDDDMKVVLDENKSVIHVSKEVPLPDVMAESVGLVGVFGKRYRNAFVKKVVNMLHSEEKLQFFWLRTFNELVSDGLKIETIEIDSNDWAEVDFHPDIMTIRKEVFANLNKKLENND